MLLNLTIRTMSRDGQKWILEIVDKFRRFARRLFRPGQHHASNHHHEELNVYAKVGGKARHTDSNEAVTHEIH